MIFIKIFKCLSYTKVLPFSNIKIVMHRKNKIQDIPGCYLRAKPIWSQFYISKDDPKCNKSTHRNAVRSDAISLAVLQGFPHYHTHRIQ